MDVQNYDIYNFDRFKMPSFQKELRIKERCLFIGRSLQQFDAIQILEVCVLNLVQCN